MTTEFDSKKLSEAITLCNEILEWADAKGSFDTTFVESVQEQIVKQDFVTERQYEALQKIYRTFDVGMGAGTPFERF